jgi:hypothetical protein
VYFDVLTHRPRFPRPGIIPRVKVITTVFACISKIDEKGRQKILFFVPWWPKIDDGK